MVLVLVVVVFGQGGDDVPKVPDAEPEDSAEEDKTDYPEFTGRVLLNGQKLELENTPLLAKGLIHLPLLELAEAVNAQVNREGNVIIVGEAGEAAPGADGNTKIYRGSTDITPANIIESGDELYVEAGEAAPLLDLNYYENLFANAMHLTDTAPDSQDGDYAVVRRRDERGWAPELRMSIREGVITAVDYLELNEEGTNKLEDQEYLDNWRATNGIEPLALVRQMEEQLLETQAPAEVDIVSGATGAWRNFVQMSANALGKAKAGALPKSYADGSYIVAGNPSDKGWTPMLEFTVSGGDIAELKYDEVDEEGKSKRENEEYLENWRSAFPEVDPVAIVAEREENILKTQDPNLIDATTGATAWGRNIKELTSGSLDQAARAELPGGHDTVYVFFGLETEGGDRPQLLLAAAGARIIAADFSEYLNGQPKKFDQEYLNNWRDQFPDVDPGAVVAEMEETFVETVDPGDLDAISGATSWRSSFQELAERALEFMGDN